jgi:hypothetical protein
VPRIAAHGDPGHGSAARGADPRAQGEAKGGRMVRFLYLVMSLGPTAAVVALAWYVVRSVSVRVVWRETGGRRLDDGPSA